MRYSALSLAWDCDHRPHELDARMRDGRSARILRCRDHRGWWARARHPRTTLRRSMASRMSRCSRKSWIGSATQGGIRPSSASNYLLPRNILFYEWSMKLWKDLEQDLNYNTMVSQRGVLNLYHSDVQRDVFARRGNAMRLHGVDAELLNRTKYGHWCPISTSTTRAFRSTAGCCSRAAARRGTTRSSGATQEPRMLSASISSRTARCPAFAFPTAASPVSRRRGAQSALTGGARRRR